jgi:hypothetical protein
MPNAQALREQAVLWRMGTDHHRLRQANGKHAEIAVRYRWMQKQNRPVPMAAIRVAELHRLLGSRWGLVLPDDDAGRDDAEVMAHHLARRPGDARKHIKTYLRRHAPWMSGDETKRLIATVMAKPRKFRADTLAARLNLTFAERARLGIKTIGAVDVDKAERVKRRRNVNRDYLKDRRRTRGAKPRADYEAGSLARTKPWLAMGLSERTWYRRGKPVPPA